MIMMQAATAASLPSAAGEPSDAQGRGPAWPRPAGATTCTSRCTDDLGHWHDHVFRFFFLLFLSSFFFFFFLLLAFASFLDFLLFFDGFFLFFFLPELLESELESESA